MTGAANVRKAVVEATVDRINREFPVGCCMREKLTGKIFVRGAELKGAKFWYMSTGAAPHKAVIAAALLIDRFEPEGE